MGGEGTQKGTGLRSLGGRGPKGVLPSTLTRKMRLSWGVSHRYSPASLLRAPRTRSTCLAPSCSSCTRPWLARRSPSLYQRTGPPGPERCTASSRSPPGVLRTLVWAASGATTRTGGSVGSELGVTVRKRFKGWGRAVGSKMGKGTESSGARRARCAGEGETHGFGGAILRFPAQAILTSHLDSEAEAGSPRGCPGLAGVEARMGRVCSPDAEDAAGALSMELQALALLNWPPVVAPKDKGASPGQFTAQHHRIPGGHTERAGGCLWGKELDRGLWTERGGGVDSVTPPPPPSPGLARSTHQPG